MADPQNIQDAKALIAIGAWVFPVYVTPVEGNPYRTTKKPGTSHGFQDSTNDPFYVEDLFDKHPNAVIGVDMGRSGLLAVDIDVKRSPEGDILVDGFENFELLWEDLPETHSFDSVSQAGGKQYIYLAPEGKNLAPSSNYRGVQGLDIRAGGSWSVWQGEIPTSRDAFAPAPEWACDEKKTRDYSQYKGEIGEWYETLEPGAPDGAVVKAMDKARALFTRQGDDLSHSDIVERQHEAIRLGAEGHTGVLELLTLLEELTLNRTGEHSRTPDEYEDEFQESLSSGIRKAGDVIALRKSVPDYSLQLVPEGVPNSLILRETPGEKADVMRLAQTLAETGTDPLIATSILWGAPVTKDLCRTWGLEFTHRLVTDAIARVQEPTEVVPQREEPDVAQEKKETVSLLTDREREEVAGVDTFLQRFVDQSEKANGFVQTAFTVPLAWSTLSLAAGLQCVIPKAGALGTNLWFIVLGYSGTGKSKSLDFGRSVIDTFLAGDETYWNTGAGSPEGIEEALVRRDGKSSALMEDEAGAFYKSMIAKDWMKTLSNKLADWYGGMAIAPQKVRLAELRGKKASVSFNYFTVSTPDDTLKVIDEDMFGTGFMARMAWVLGPKPVDNDERYRTTRADLTKSGKPLQAMELGADLLLFSQSFPRGSRTELWGTDQAVARLEKAFKQMDQKAKKHPKYGAIIQPSVIRLDETMWKCAGLLAMYRGSTEFDIEDALMAISHVETWYRTVLEVSTQVAGMYQRDAQMMVDYIKEQGGAVQRKGVVRQFGGIISRSKRELDDRLDFLQEAGYCGVESRDGVPYLVAKD